MKILLIEDNSGDATLLKLGLEAVTPTVSVTWKTTAEDALLALESEPAPYDLILLDLNLPHMSGAQFVSAVSTSDLPETVPIVILSGTHGSQIVGLPNVNRTIAYIPKPADLEGYRKIGKYISDSWRSTEWKESTEVPVRFKRVHKPVHAD